MGAVLIIVDVESIFISNLIILNFHFHDLRHSGATMLLDMGVHPKIVQERLGHHDIGTTMDIYSHVLPSMQEGAIKQLNSLLGSQPKQP